LRVLERFGITKVHGVTTRNQILTYALATTNGVTRETRQTTTVRTVVNHPTLSTASADTWTGIDTVLLDTRQGQITLAGDGTLGSTGRWGSNKVGKTLANCLVVQLSTLRVGTTRRGLTGAGGNRFRQGCREKWG